MDRNPESPWKPGVPANITPAQFEELVRSWLKRVGAGKGTALEATHLGVVHGAGGNYKIDVLVKLTVFTGASIVVLVECKHQARPVERDEVMVLHAKLSDVGAHKGMLFSTSGFQKGALEYATAHGIATVAVVRGQWLYETRAAGSAPTEPPPWVRFDEFAGVRMTITEKGISCHSLEMARLDALEEWFTENVKAP